MCIRDRDWHAGFAKSFGVVLNGQTIMSKSSHGERVFDDDFTLLFNAHHEPIEFRLVHDQPAVVECDTALPRGRNGRSRIDAKGAVTVEGRSMVVLRHEK